MAEQAIVHQIDKGTPYDVPGFLRRLAAAIERGDHGNVREVVCCIRTHNSDGNKRTQGFWAGLETYESAVVMLERVKHEFLFES